MEKWNPKNLFCRQIPQKRLNKKHWVKLLALNYASDLACTQPWEYITCWFYFCLRNYTKAGIRVGLRNAQHLWRVIMFYDIFFSTLFAEVAKLKARIIRIQKKKKRRNKMLLQFYFVHTSYFKVKQLSMTKWSHEDKRIAAVFVDNLM